jgi:hypothetical protein
MCYKYPYTLNKCLLPKAASCWLFKGEDLMAKKKKAITIQASVEQTVAPVLAAELQSSPDLLLSAVSTQERIALLAYTYWEQRGRTGGSPEEDWLRAEQEVLSQMSAVQS